jgi:hypothetical protein
VIVPFLLVAAVMLITRVEDYLGEVKMAGGNGLSPEEVIRRGEARAPGVEEALY